MPPNDDTEAFDPPADDDATKPLDLPPAAAVPASPPHLDPKAEARVREFQEKRRVEAAAAPTRRRPWVWYMSTGPDVAAAQNFLAVCRVYDTNADEADEVGFYGPATQQAVEAFQTSKGLNPSGVLDDDTWVALEAAAGAR